MRKILTILIMAMMALLPAQMLGAENNKAALLAKAQAEYSNGHFEQCDSMLKALIPSTKGVMLTNAYKLAALSRLQQDDIEGVQTFVNKLLKSDPFFTPALDDPQRFVDIVASSKLKGVTITTASRQVETLEETPVPVTVITEEMIRMSGAQTLRDLLCLFVPSMTRIENMEANMSMRGLYANTQEDVLIMLDGHRLNSGTTNGEAPDFRNSISKIKQIEVLRGPASSLYGNVALMAVVNIITKNGSELNGAELSARFGSYNSYGADAVFGKGNLNGELFAWGSIYASEGEKVEIDKGTHYLEGYNSKPAYDLGIKARWSDVSLTFAHQHSKPIPFYSQLTLAPTNYDNYNKIDGNGPGSSRTTTHAYVDYNHSWDKWALSASLYGDMERATFYNPLADRVTPEVAAGLFDVSIQEGTVYAESIENIWLVLAWENFSAGLNVNASTEYKLGSQHGSILFGAQADIYAMTSSKCMQGFRYQDWFPLEDEMDRENLTTINNIIGLHTEHTISAYVQLKNYITKNLIFNGGLRFDSKHRYNETFNTLSPRLALIYTPTPSSNIKLCYARSLVDAPYLYRSNTLQMYNAGAHLNLQKNDAFQLSGSKMWDAINLRTELNFYYNRLRDLCIFNYSGIKKGDMSAAFNVAEVDVAGAELVAEYKTKKTFVNLNMSYKKPLRLVDYGKYDKEMLNDPFFILNLSVNQRIFKLERGGTLSIHGNLHYQTKAKMLKDNYVGSPYVPDYDCPQQAIVNAGISWEYKRMGFNVDVYNLFNSDYKYGTLLQSWQPAQSTKVMGKVSIKL